ncbi:uncharacterized protein GIQ15_03303 [Arthroderma uncinatum]|uniref:uncharacterized protein n=1 Tax=Arthroderma uncinatum TaxID=74035 RepID=UPI00144A9FF1|nr:uncharacterized protein GIQ15_03303 [Arthroderma uncinatum]KAF3483979.1 hypothetical protein GIQ15_03303 [Arthroderma uncinatum]
MLRDILALLVNCRSFEVYYGATPTDQDTPASLGGSSAASTILYAIAERGLPVKSLTLGQRAGYETETDIWAHGSVEGHLLSIHDFETPTFITAVSYLQSLTLKYELKFQGVYWTLELLRAANNLEKLHVCFDVHISTAYFFHHLIIRDTLPCLRELTLESCLFASSGTVIALLRSFRSTLRVLSLNRARLAANNWISVLHELRDNIQSLTKIKLYDLREGVRSSESAGMVVNFPGLHENKLFFKRPRAETPWIDDWEKEVDAEYSGQDMKAALQVIASIARVDYLVVVLLPGGSRCHQDVIVGSSVAVDLIDLEYISAGAARGLDLEHIHTVASAVEEAVIVQDRGMAAVAAGYRFAAGMVVENMDLEVVAVEGMAVEGKAAVDRVVHSAVQVEESCFAGEPAGEAAGYLDP